MDGAVRSGEAAGALREFASQRAAGLVSMPPVSAPTPTLEQQGARIVVTSFFWSGLLYQ